MALSTRDAYLRRTYDITEDEFDSLVEDADGRCPICLKPFASTPVVDHDHRTKVVRGVLCTHCNYRVVGRHRDPGVFERAARYLADPPAVRVLGEERRTPTKRRSRGNVTRARKVARSTPRGGT